MVEALLHTRQAVEQLPQMLLAGVLRDSVTLLDLPLHSTERRDHHCLDVVCGCV